MAEIAVQVRYPVPAGARLTLRTDQDWQHDLTPWAIDAGADRWTFRFPATALFHYFKPVLHQGGEPRWAQGNNYLILADGHDTCREVFPYFDGDDPFDACDLQTLAAGERRHRYRVFYPPGYAENTLKHYPVLYMQDGQNLFFPQEAFAGQTWRVRETLLMLDQMNIVDKLIVVGIYPQDRLTDYTFPGYEAYGRFVAETLKPAIDAGYRTLRGPENTALMGASLGGVVSFYLGWQYPEIFGMAACMSTSFGYRDDLFAKVGREPKKKIRFYLDSGWPRDNYEVTRDMRALLGQRGFREGCDLFYLAFPEALHTEKEWALRVHIPIQLFFGGLRIPKDPAAAEAAAQPFS